MKLLALEAVQNASYYLSRYHQVEAFGGELFVLNGLGEPGYWPAPRYHVVGSKHIDEIVTDARKWHKTERFDGVLSFSESAVLTVATVADALGLPGVGLATARTSRNKLLMREAHERGDVPRPRFRFVPDLRVALETAEEFGYPVVLKPTLGAASNFVFRLDNPEDLRLRFGQALEGIQRMSWFTMEPDGIDHGPEGLLIESFLEAPSSSPKRWLGTARSTLVQLSTGSRSRVTPSTTTSTTRRPHSMVNTWPPSSGSWPPPPKRRVSGAA